MAMSAHQLIVHKVGARVPRARGREGRATLPNMPRFVHLAQFADAPGNVKATANLRPCREQHYRISTPTPKNLLALFIASAPPWSVGLAVDGEFHNGGFFYKFGIAIQL